MQPHIIIVSNTSWSISNFRTGLIKALLDKGCMVTAVAPTDKYEHKISAMGCAYIPLKNLQPAGTNPLKDWKLYREFINIFTKEKPDLVLLYTPKPNIFGSMAAAKLDIKYMNTVNGLGYTFQNPGLLSKVVLRLYRKGFRKSHHVFFQNRDDLEFLLSHKTLHAGKASLVAGSGVDINIMMPVNKTDNSKFVFLLCTRLIAEKGVMEFIAAAKELSGQFPKAAFRIIGKPAIHPNAIDISIITKYQREGVIEYFEEVDNISEALSNADVLVHPSYYKEGIPRILLEGLSKGLPIITTNSVGCKETVDHLKNGLLVEPKNIASLVNAMHYMLNASAAELKEMSNYSRQKAVNQFDERIVIDEYLKYFPSGIFSELKTTSAAAEINRPRKIRQIIVVNRFVIGGPVMHIASRIDYNKSGYDSLLVVGEMDEGEKEATHLIKQYNLKIVHIKEMKRNISPWNDYIAYIKMKKLIRSFNPDIVDTHAAKAGLVGRLAAFKCKVPVITHTFHGHVFHSYFGSLKTKLIIYIERWLAKKATAIIAVSELQKKELAEVYKICTPEKIKVLPIGLAVEKFQQDSAKQRCTFRKEYFLDDDEVAIGIIGRIVPIKNHTYFLRLAKAALQQTKKKLRFFIIGDGSIRHQLEREAEHLLLSFTYFPDNKKKADIIFTSWIIDIETAYAGLDIIALTSLNEGTPVSLIEAQAAGKPVISTAVGGVNDVMINNETGFCIEPADFQNFTDKLIVLAENESLRNEMGCKGKKFSEENYSTGRVFAQTHKYYKECLEKAGVI